MSFEGKIVKVMLASPGDVANERKIAREVIHEWNAIHAEDRSTILLPVSWETNAAPATGDRPQEIINKQILRGADLLIAVFWTRLGTPTGIAASGTIEEIEEHLRANKPAMLYFSSAPVRLESVDDSQFHALTEFKKSIKTRALVEEYDSISEFKDKLTRQLAQIIIQHYPSRSAQSEEPSITPYASAMATTRILQALSSEARELLKEAIHDQSGRILVVHILGGLSMSTNGRNMLSEPKNARLQATWRSALQELVNEELIEQRDSKGEIFAVTEKGFNTGEMLE